MILLEVNAQSLADVKTLIDREGVTGFRLFMAYPGVLMVDDGALFKAMRVAGANGAMICVHAENEPVIQVLTEEAVAAGHTSPKHHMLTRPLLMEGEATHPPSVSPNWRKCRFASFTSRPPRRSPP
jgi:dihydropyrimidinase